MCFDGLVMGNFLLLTQKNICPSCRIKRGTYSGNCFKCGTRLFTDSNFDMQKFEDESGVRHWWCYDRRDGWKHRDHWMTENAAPLIRHYEAPKLPKDYGTKLPPVQAKAKRVRRK
jgi:hypothetical protein